MQKRHSVQIPTELWKKLCEDASLEMNRRYETVTPSSRLKEILKLYFEKKKAN